MDYAYHNSTRLLPNVPVGLERSKADDDYVEHNHYRKNTIGLV
jgi:hypothetical protein